MEVPLAVVIDFLSSVAAGASLETTVDLFCSLRFGGEESEQGRIPIGKYIKFPFQRVLICPIWSSDEETAPVSILEVLSVRRRRSCATRSKGAGFLQ